jgi:hypothetical protein
MSVGSGIFVSLESGFMSESRRRPMPSRITSISSMGLHHTELGMAVNRKRNATPDNLSRMPYNVKKVLWENVLACMVKAWGGENLNRLAREAKFGPGTSSRIKEQETSVGVDVVEKVARLFRIPPATLLLPDAEKDLLTIAEAYRVDPAGREYLVLTAKGILRKHGRDQAGEADSA